MEKKPQQMHAVKPKVVQPGDVVSLNFSIHPFLCAAEVSWNFFYFATLLTTTLLALKK